MRVLALIAAAASLAAMAWFARPLFVVGDARLAEHLVEQIADLGDAEAAGFVTGISLDDERALRVLVELAASSRHSVARQAQTRLDDWLETLERRASDGSVGADQAGPLLLSVADELVARADGLGTGAAAWAARLGRKLVATSDLVPARDRMAFINRCDAVLMNGKGNSRQRNIPWDAPRGSISHGRARARAPAASVEQRLLAYALQRGPLSSDFAATTLAAAPPGEAASLDLNRTSNLSIDDPGGRRDSIVEREAASADPTAAGPAVAWRSPNDELYGRVRPASDASSDTIDVPSPDAAQAREEELIHAPLAEVIAVLISHDRFESAVAQAALRRRGMSAIDLEIARRLPGADAEARRTLLEEVARRPGANLSGWLQYFAADESADVRFGALGLLATSRDEAVVADVYARAVRDDDPRIRALAGRLREADAMSR